MNKKFLAWIAVFLLVSMNNNAQKKVLTIEELVPGGTGYSKFVPKLKYNAQWFKDKYVYVEKDTMYAIDPEKPGSKEKLITNAELRKLLVNEKANVNNIQFLRYSGEVFIPDGYVKQVGDETHVSGRVTSKKNQIWGSLAFPDSAGTKQVYFTMDESLNTSQFMIIIKKEWENVDVCIQNKKYLDKYAAFTIDNNLYIAGYDGIPKAVTDEKNKGIVCGTEVHRSEFGITKGTFWSPAGNYLAFYRKDETMVGDYPLVDISAREAKLDNIKYPMAGMKSHEVTIGIYDIKTETTVYLKTGAPKDRYFTNISWSPDERYIYIAELNRGQDTCNLVCYNARTGMREKVLFQETNEKYVEPQHPLLFFEKNPELFIWQSRRDGYNHLYVYNTDGTLKKQLTSGSWEVLDVLGFDEKEESLFITSNEPCPIESHVYKVDLKTGKRMRLTPDSGRHSSQMSLSGSYILDVYSNQHTPKNVDLINTKTGKATRLFEAPDPYTGYQMPEITLGTIKAADGVSDLYYRLVKPVDFDASRKYPVVIYVYGGPHSQMVQNGWLAGTRGWDIYMAQKGYIVFTMDNRGTANRGLAFENVTHRKLGMHEAEDQMKGVEFLKTLSYVDPERIGVHGWSYGGFMATNLMLRYPETFKVGVAGGPVIDWKYYEVMYGERYMDLPKDNKEGYENSNLNNLAGNLKGHLLLIHGDEDPTVVWQNSLSFLSACIKARTYPDYFVYPGHGHNMIGVDRVHLHEKITRYFDDYLK